MKLTKEKLKQIIREELASLTEASEEFQLTSPKDEPGEPETFADALPKEESKPAHYWILKALAKFPPNSPMRKHAEAELENLVYTEPGTQMTLGHVAGAKMGLEEDKEKN